MSRTVGLLHYPWGEDYGVSRTPRRSPQRAYASAIAYRANPRSPEYMGELLAELEPDAALVRTSDSDWKQEVASADRVIALFPDSTGLGWSGLERSLAKLSATPAEAINGRRRRFALDGKTRRELRMRRALERSMLVEVVVVTTFALMTPVLLAIDFLRGRR
jgi:hypothetical protein